jgi:GDP-L-fucose synthase
VIIASGIIHSIRYVVEALDELTGSSVEILWDSTKPDGQGRRFYNLDRLHSIGFSPQYNLKQGLAETWNWYAANYPNVRA